MPDHHSPSPSSGGEHFASEADAYHALCAYSLSLRDRDFLHQYVVDTWTVQNATVDTTPLALTFAMFGLYCAVQKHISGRQVQRFHMQMARARRVWPALALPQGTPCITAIHVMRTEPGPERDRAVCAWAAETWALCGAARSAIVQLAHSECGIAP